MVDSYFYDTYALVEISKGNKNYLMFKDCGIVTTKLNLLELYSSLLRDFNEEKADFFYEFFSKFCVGVNDEIMKESVKFWILMRKQKKKPSYIDCIGYVIAKRFNIKFLTGDEAFRSLPNVEFVK